MTIDFQLGILAYLAQDSSSLQYLQNIDEDILDPIEYKLALQILKKYHSKYDNLPGAAAAMEYAEREIKQTRDITDDLANDIRDTIEAMYLPLDPKDKVMIEDSIVVEVQKKQVDQTVMEFAEGRITNEQLFKRMDKISSISGFTEEEYSDGGFLAQDHNKFQDDYTEGHPTFLDDLNNLTAAGGFYSPQLVIFLSGPKRFKTGLLLNIAVNYARNGYNVYYADGENGARSIRNRARQVIMHCTTAELYDPEVQEELEELLKRFNLYMGGDLFIDSYPAHSKSPKDVKGRLEYLYRTRGFKPDIIIWDSIDHFIPSNPADQKRDIRIQIQRVYMEVINVNKALGCFSIAPSQVNRGALDKKVFTEKDLSEDFGKAFNAHAIFGICATDEEEKSGIRRIVPILQREGESFKGKNMCVVRVDEARMQITEIDKDKYLEAGITEDIEVDDD